MKSSVVRSAPRSRVAAWLRQIWRLACASIVAVTAFAGLAQAQVQPETYELAWCWAHDPASSIGVSYACSTPYRFASRFDAMTTPPFSVVHAPTEGVNVTRTGVGRYLVRIPRLAASGGTAHATSYATSGHCKVLRWGPSGTDMQVFVDCYDAAGRPANAFFTVLFYKAGATGQLSHHAYAWSDRTPPPGGCYTVSSTYGFNPNGPLPSVCDTGVVGQYEVRVSNIVRTDRSGLVMVTGYGSSSARCKVVSWSGSAPLRARVACYEGSTRVSSPFTFSFIQSPGVIATRVSEDVREGYYASVPATGTVPTFAQSDSYGGMAAIRVRTSPGKYRVELPGVKGIDSTVQLVARGFDDAHCTVDGWGGDDLHATVNVSCWRGAQPADSAFSLYYLTDRFILF